MKNQMKKKRIAAALCAGLVFLAPLHALAAEKNEIVYGILRSDGSLDSVYTVNRFESESSETITDYGAYRRVDNLTDATPLALQSDGIRFTLPAGTFFYQGEPVGASLLWSFRVQYLLGGAAVAPEDLSGADGELEIQITIGQGNPKYQGADTLLTGTNSLSRGAGQPDSRTSGMDTQIEEAVNSTLSSLTGGEEPLVSYMDERNDVALVQFVLRIPGVSEKAVPEETVEEETEKSF